MAFKLPELPYAMDALAPHISKETLEYHYGKHHKTYVDKLNGLVEGSEHEKKSLEEIIVSSQGPVFNNAAQVWNHSFYWNCLSPNGGGEPTGRLKEEIEKSFGNFSSFKEKFSQAAVNHFGSGWAWLSKDAQGNLKVDSTMNAVNPMNNNEKPLLTCDVWEHAFYIDYRNQKPKYIEAFWNLVNWEFVEKNLSG